MNDEAPSAGPTKGDQAPSDQPPGFPPGSHAPSGAQTPPGSHVPPWVSTASAAWARQKLVRPRDGRYVAGVCGALGRATNTDPVLWRVLLAVLGVLSGAGVLLYLIGWLIIPSEGDTASPIESLLGKGRSGMAPLSVVLLGGAALMTFAFIVNSGARASMLAAAVILGAFLLIKRGNVPAFQPGTAPPATPPPAPPATSPTAPTATTAASPTVSPGASPAASPVAEEPTLAFAGAPTTDPGAEPMTAPAPAAVPPLFPPPPPYTPPAPPPSGFRPPFAPHGPFAGPPTAAPVAPRGPKPPKPPKERSILGRLTFFAVVMVTGLIAALDMSGVDVEISAYFAAALVTTALGLIVGAWFGRARGLIALALLLCFGLGVSVGVERLGQDWTPSVYRPATITAVADQYEFNVGNVTLDLRQVDFAGVTQHTVVDMKLGQLRVLLPPTVDATVEAGVEGGRLVLFGEEFSDSAYRQTTDLGSDGTGGGTLTLDIRLEAGNVEVIR